MSKSELERGLGLAAAASVVVGTIVGTGVFLKSSVMAQLLGNGQLVLVAWIVAGLVSIAGALTYAELSTLFPEAGGEYVYLRKAYGDLAGFLYGWMRFWIASPGSIAAYAVGAATFLSGSWSLGAFGGSQMVAISFIFIFTLLNSFRVGVSGGINVAVTVLKIVLILGLPAGIFFFAQPASMNLPVSAAFTHGSASAFGMALLAAFWAYDGWNNLAMIAGEVKNPVRNLPLALIFGMLIVLFLYCLVNASYFAALPVGEVENAFSSRFPDALPVATKAAGRFLSARSVPILSLVLAISALGAMHGSMLANARVPYALAVDGLFPRFFAKVAQTTSVPLRAVWTQGGIAALLAFWGTFDQLTDYVIFASWIFYGLCAWAVFRFRRNSKFSAQVFRTWGYPWVPFLFIVVSVLLLVNTIATTPGSSLIGIGFILAGIPVYHILKLQKAVSRL